MRKTIGVLLTAAALAVGTANAQPIRPDTTSILRWTLEQQTEWDPAIETVYRTATVKRGDTVRPLPKAERYSYVFEGNSQVLDQILVSNPLLRSFPVDYDPVHVNAEFADQASDHDPQVARLDLRGRPSPT